MPPLDVYGSARIGNCVLVPPQVPWQSVGGYVLVPLQVLQLDVRASQRALVETGCWCRRCAHWSLSACAAAGCRLFGVARRKVLLVGADGFSEILLWPLNPGFSQFFVGTIGPLRVHGPRF